MSIGKRVRKLLLCFMVGLCFAGCGREQTNMVEGVKEHVVYDVNHVKLFDVDENSKLYIYDDDNKLKILQPDGKVEKEYLVESAEWMGFCAGNEHLFMLLTEQVDGYPYEWLMLREMDLSDGSSKIVYSDGKAYSAAGICKLENQIFFVTRNEKEESEKKSDITAQYLDCGEQLVCFDVETGNTEIISLECLKMIAKKSEKELWIYGFDVDIRKFYFATFDVHSKQLGEKRYTDQHFNPFLQDFAYDEEMDKLLMLDFMNTQTILAYDPTELNANIGLYKVENGASDAQICCVNGYSYFLANGCVHRIRNNDYWRKTQQIVVYCGTYEYNLPEDSGYLLRYEYVDEEQMAMAVMAGNCDYDLLLLETESPIAENIRKIGAYEPLNSLKDVENYFDSSFDYIREAATDSNGAVWMLPCDISMDVLVFQSQLCNEYDLFDGGPITNQSLREAERKLKGLELEGKNIYYQYNYARDGLSRQIPLYVEDYAYQNGRVCFDSVLFQQLCENIKEEMNDDTQLYHNSTLADAVKGLAYDATEEEEANHFRNYFSNVAFVCADRHTLAREYRGRVDSQPKSILSYDFFDVQQMPVLEIGSEQAPIATAYMLVVNPKSSHLEEVKAYVAYLAERLCEKESIYLTKNLKGEYRDNERKVHDIYAKGRIVFEYPRDVFWEDFVAYLNGRITYQHMTSEIERKLNVYLKE